MNMEKMDPIKTAEKLRDDAKLNSELDADLEKALGEGKAGSKQEEVGDKQKLSREEKREKILNEMEKKRGEGKWVSDIRERDKHKKIEEKEDSREEKREEILKKMEVRGEGKWADDIREKDKKKETGEVNGADKFEKEMSEEEINEVAELELADKFEKENKEELSPEKETDDEKLEMLSEELRKAREEYVKNDYEMDKKSNKFARAFGFRVGLGEFEGQMEECKNKYEEALKKYKDAVIDSEYVGDKEDIEIATQGLVMGECLNRESFRADLEAQEKGWSKTLMKGFTGLMEGYRKQSFKKKLLIGASIAGTGFALSTVGGVAAMGGAGIVVGYRVFSIGVSSVGFSQMFEAWAQKGKGKKAEKEVEKIKDSGFEELDSGVEVNYEKLKKSLDENIEKIDSKIQKEKQWRVWRKYMGVGAGIGMSTLGRYLGGEVAKHFGGETPEMKNVMHVSPDFEDGTDPLEGSSEVNSEAMKAGAEGALHNPEADALGGSGVNKEAIKDQVEQVLGGHKLDAEAVGGIEIARSGDSVWKLAENQLESRGYFKGLTGTPEEILAKKTYLIDAIKDKIAENPKDFGLTDVDKIKVGQKIDFSDIFENKNDIENILNKAESLGKGDMESITQNLEGKSSLQEAMAQTAGATAEQSNIPTEIPRMLGLSPAEYNAVNKLNVEEFLEKYGNNKDYAELSKLINNQMENVSETSRLTVDQLLARISPEEYAKLYPGQFPGGVEIPAAGASVEAPAAEMQNRLLTEVKIAHALGLDPREYSAINDMKVGKFLDELNNPNKSWPDLPHHGAYGSFELGDHIRLGEFIKSQMVNIPGSSNLSIKEFLMSVNLDTLPEDSSVLSKSFSPEDSAKYLAGVLQQETAETIKICAGNIEEWNNVKNVHAVELKGNEIVENIEMAVSKTLPESAAIPARNDTVETWMIKITKEAYERGTLDELREQLSRSHKT